MQFFVQFDTPHHGWLQTHFRTNDAELTIDISDILGEPIYYLISGICLYLNGRTEVECSVFLEPEWLILELKKSDNKTHFTVSTKPKSIHEEKVLLFSVEAEIKIV